MVAFGSYGLQHVTDVRVQETRVINDRLILSGTVGYRADQTAGGRIITVQGQIRDDPDYVLRLKELGVRADDVARPLDLEDDSSPISAKLGTVQAVWTVEDGVDAPTYSATFYETS